jgi:YesN/AraC family two-component response regulator
MLAMDLVEHAGLEALEAENADDAITLLSTDPSVRILMTDINMPGSMDGIKLAAVVRERYPLIGIVVVSGKAQLDPRQLPYGSVFLAKPYDIDHLSETLRRLAA